MYFRVKNNDVATNYPLVKECFELVELYERSTGKTYNAIEIKDLSALLNLDAICKTCNSNHLGIKISGNEISLLQQKFEFEDEL